MEKSNTKSHQRLHCLLRKYPQKYKDIYCVAELIIKREFVSFYYSNTPHALHKYLYIFLAVAEVGKDIDKKSKIFLIL
ncbi:hypothetical protein CRV08_02285 [Halarcobacter ebronensis]|uniref:Uncharacterized protein n=1 Tax=Halarcobacter ebronensis TaxID=1462615 RepID=A0A4Q0YGW8_9BACT|nr:hypothetical protein CRV08_02285 [Halarcobacter ebronensis]